MLLSLVSKLPFTIWKPEPTFTVASNLCMWVSKRKKNNNKTLRALVGNGNPLQYFCLDNPADRVVWQATVHGGGKESKTTEQLRMHTHVQQR